MIAIFSMPEATNRFHCQQRLGDFSIKYRAIDEVYLDFSTFERIESYISAGIDQLPNVGLVVLHSNEANEMSPGRHVGWYENKLLSF